MIFPAGNVGENGMANRVAAGYDYLPFRGGSFTRRGATLRRLKPRGVCKERAGRS